MANLSQNKTTNKTESQIHKNRVQYLKELTKMKVRKKKIQQEESKQHLVQVVVPDSYRENMAQSNRDLEHIYDRIYHSSHTTVTIGEDDTRQQRLHVLE